MAIVSAYIFGSSSGFHAPILCYLSLHASYPCSCPWDVIFMAMHPWFICFDNGWFWLLTPLFGRLHSCEEHWPGVKLTAPLSSGCKVRNIDRSLSGGGYACFLHSWSLFWLRTNFDYSPSLFGGDYNYPLFWRGINVIHEIVRWHSGRQMWMSPLTLLVGVDVIHGIPVDECEWVHSYCMWDIWCQCICMCTSVSVFIIYMRMGDL